MLVMGLLGGTINHLLTKDVRGETYLGRCLLVGLGASLLAPLFLKVISSNLLTQQNPPDYLQYLYFGGFCLIASISSKAFIKTLSDRILKEAEDANKKAGAAQQTAQAVQETVAEVSSKAEALVAKETEKDDAEPIGTQEKNDGTSGRNLPSQGGAGTNMSTVGQNEWATTEERMVLEAIGAGKFTFRSLSGIAQELDLTRETVQQSVNHLVAKGLLGQTKSKLGGLRWYATEAGRRILNSASPEVF